MKHVKGVVAVLSFAALAFGCGATHQYYGSSGTPNVIGTSSEEYASASQPSDARTEKISLSTGETGDQSNGGETEARLPAASDPPTQSVHTNHYYPIFGWRDSSGHRLPN